MNVEFSPKLKKRTIEFCDDELNYHINDSGCAEEYHNEIVAQIEILALLGKKTMAKDYAAQYEEYLVSEIEDVEFNDAESRRSYKTLLKDLEKLMVDCFKAKSILETGVLR